MKERKRGNMRFRQNTTRQSQTVDPVAVGTAIGLVLRLLFLGWLFRQFGRGRAEAERETSDR